MTGTANTLRLFFVRHGESGRTCFTWRLRPLRDSNIDLAQFVQEPVHLGYQRTKGNPLFIQEVIRNTLELRRVGGQNPDHAAVFDSLDDDDMPEGLRRVGSVASVLCKTRQLVQLGCGRGRGHLFARPVSATKLAGRLARNALQITEPVA